MAGGIGGDDSEDLNEAHEINVTPFIDVILVLLIIFMVAAPLSTVDVPVDLPVSNSKPVPRPDKPVYLTIKGDRSLALGNDAIQPATLRQALDAATQADRERRIFVRADKGVPYGEVMNALNLLREAGYLKIALVGLESVGPAPDATKARP